MFPLLEFLDSLIAKGNGQFSSSDVAAARLALLKPTHMVDYAGDVYKSLNNGAVPPELEEQKQAVFKELNALREGCKVLEELCTSEGKKEERVSLGFGCDFVLLVWKRLGASSSSTMTLVLLL